jgi:hypothetical protein
MQAISLLKMPETINKADISYQPKTVELSATTPLSDPVISIKFSYLNSASTNKSFESYSWLLLLLFFAHNLSVPTGRYNV